MLLFLAFIFLTTLLCTNLFIYSIFSIPNGGSVILVAAAILAAGGYAARTLYTQISRRRWIIAVPIVLCVMLIAFIPSLFVVIPEDLIDVIRFNVNADSYLTQVAKNRDSGHPQFVTFPWGISVEQLLIFDETDELAYPARMKSIDWWRRAGSDIRACRWNAKGVGKHFYIVRISCL